MEDEEIQDIISKNEKLDSCVGLSATLNLYTKKDSMECKEFTPSYLKDLKERKRKI